MSDWTGPKSPSVPTVRKRSTLSTCLRVASLIVVIAILAYIPEVNRTIGSILPGPLNSSGTLQLFAQVLVFASLAVSLDVILGYSGLMPFGHVMNFALGSYLTVALTRGPGFSLVVAGIGAVLITALVSALVNALGLLRYSPLTYTMVSLAFAQVLYIGIQRNFLHSGGEVGIVFPDNTLPSGFTAIAGTKNLFWLALVLTIFVCAVARWFAASEWGHLCQGIRENELRLRVLGVNTYAYKLGVSILGSTLAALCGVAYAVIEGGADPSEANLFLSLALILMVVLGGRGYVWGALIGGMVYEFLSLRLIDLGQASSVEKLPLALRVPLSEPQVLLGVGIVLVIIFYPGGIWRALLDGRARLARLVRRSPKPSTTESDPVPCSQAVGG